MNVLVKEQAFNYLTTKEPAADVAGFFYSTLEKCWIVFRGFDIVERQTEQECIQYLIKRF